MKKCTSIFLYLMMLILASCEVHNSTKEKLLEVRNATKIDEKELTKAFDKNVSQGFTKDGIQYGIITLQNSEKIKYWFETHHLSKDRIGGTLFEMPNGDLEFIRGYFCCEVQLPKQGQFKNTQIFLEEMRKIDGIEP